jgi:hypothetical protein
MTALIDAPGGSAAPITTSPTIQAQAEVQRMPAPELSEVLNGINNFKNAVHAAAAASATPASQNGVVSDPFTLSHQFAYTPRRIKVFTVGAGFSGLLMAHKFQHRFPDMRDIVDHTIFEARSDVGGTWLVNTYPGVQCDVPAHIYVSEVSHGDYRTFWAELLPQAFPFDPNPEWSRFYASGAEIEAYIKSTVKKWSLDRDIQFNTKVIGAEWQEEIGQWKVTLEHEGNHRVEHCHVLISAQGVLVYVNFANFLSLLYRIGC